MDDEKLDDEKLDNEISTLLVESVIFDNSHVESVLQSKDVAGQFIDSRIVLSGTLAMAAISVGFSTTTETSAIQLKVGSFRETCYSSVGQGMDEDVSLISVLWDSNARCASMTFLRKVSRRRVSR